MTTINNYETSKNFCQIFFFRNFSHIDVCYSYVRQIFWCHRCVRNPFCEHFFVISMSVFLNDISFCEVCNNKLIYCKKTHLYMTTINNYETSKNYRQWQYLYNCHSKRNVRKKISISTYNKKNDSWKFVITSLFIVFQSAESTIVHIIYYLFTIFFLT
jgi:hypothetical protein